MRPPHSHSIIRIAPNKLICLCKKFLRLENSRRPNRQMRMAFEFKEEFGRSRNSPLSATINIDGSSFPESTGTAGMAENYRQQREGLTTMSLGAIAGRLPTVLRPASPATCRASVARYGQSREKRSVRGEPAGYELGE